MSCLKSSSWNDDEDAAGVHGSGGIDVDYSDECANCTADSAEACATCQVMIEAEDGREWG